MQLVYQTGDMTRAQQIMDLLDEAGIETSMQGIHTWSIERTPLTVWVLDDGELARANQLLQEFFASEAPQRQLPAFQPERNLVALWLFLSALVLAIAIGVALYST